MDLYLWNYPWTLSSIHANKNRPFFQTILQDLSGKVALRPNLKKKLIGEENSLQEMKNYVLTFAALVALTTG